MFTALALFAGLIGVIVTGSAVLFLMLHLKKPYSSVLQNISIPMLRWNVFDYIVLLVFMTGGMFLFVDLIAVIRDRKIFPDYHVGYLICGFALCFLGALFLFARLGVLLTFVRSGGASTPHDESEPHQADQTK